MKSNISTHEQTKSLENHETREDLSSQVATLENLLALLNTSEGEDKLKNIFQHKKSKD